MSLELKTGSGLSASKLGLGLGHGAGATIGSVLGTTLLIVGGILIWGYHCKNPYAVIVPSWL